MPLPLALPLLLPLLAAPAPQPRRPERPAAPLLAQSRSVEASRLAWMVALPAKATIRLRQGGSLTGRLSRLSPTALTLSAGHQSQTVALANVATIVFAMPEDLWITLPAGGRQRLRPIRGLTVPISPVPSAALRLQPSGDTASVDLSSVLNAAQFARLTTNSRALHVLREIEVGPEGMLTMRARAYGLE
jgi:hypothetical protein